MSRKATIAILCVLLLWYASGIFNEAVAQSEERLDQTKSFWVKAWNWLNEHKFVFTMIIVATITIFSTVMATLKRDNLLKTLQGHLVTIEMKNDRNDNRYRGRLRVESDGMEVVAEKADGSHEKVSYLLRKDEYSGIHALVRYHDFLTDREKAEREAEVDRVHHPSIGMRMRRRFRNIINEMRRVATEAFTYVFRGWKPKFAIEASYTGEIEKAGQEAIGYATEAAYDALIDRLIGTRVVAWINNDLEYVGVLKDYTKDFIELLDVDYRNNWDINLYRWEQSKHERGLILQKAGDDIVIQSKSPFKVTLRHVFWQEDRPKGERKDVNQTIEPFGELRFRIVPPGQETGVASFAKLRLPVQYHYQEYKRIEFQFESVRTADIVLLKNYGIVRHRTEKYEPRLLDFGVLADSLLTSKSEALALKGNPTSTPLTIHNGYLTNLPRERMDLAELDGQIYHRWKVGNFFVTIDRKFRPVPKHYFLGLLPIRKARKVLALIALTMMIRSDEKRRKDPLLPLIYFTICNANRCKWRQSYKQQVLIKKKRRPFKSLLPDLLRFRLPRRAVPTEVPIEK